MRRWGNQAERPGRQAERRTVRILEKRFPFSLERRRRGDLAGQIADVLREAMATGYWKPGDVIPTIRKLAGDCCIAVGCCSAAQMDLPPLGVDVRQLPGCEF